MSLYNVYRMRPLMIKALPFPIFLLLAVAFILNRTWATPEQITLAAIGSEAPVSESQIFDWWDDGLISGEEAQELFQLVEEENFEEACHLAEALTLETCQEKKAPGKPKKVPKKKHTQRPSLEPHGSVTWKIRVDSLGDEESRTLDIHLKFYRYTLRLGTHSQLAYKNDGAEAYFGQIASKEFHSLLPTDTLWGTALTYPIGKFSVQGVLDTAFNTQVQGGFRWSQDLSASLFLWRYSQTISAGLQLHSSWGEIAGWWQQGQDKPLIKIQLQNRTKKSKDLPLVLSWKTSAYLHGKDVPEVSNLSNTLLKNKLSANQMISAGFPQLWNSLFTANLRVLAPLENDSLKTRLKVALESGPSLLRIATSGTCQELNDYCRQKDLKFKVTSEGIGDYALGATLKTRHTRDRGFSAPQVETQGIYQPSKGFFTKLALVFPKGNPQKHTQIRTETALGLDFFTTSMMFTFRKTDSSSFHPVHGIFQLKWLF